MFLILVTKSSGLCAAKLPVDRGATTAPLPPAETFGARESWDSSSGTVGAICAGGGGGAIGAFDFLLRGPGAGNLGLGAGNEDALEGVTGVCGVDDPFSVV